ncbi:PREDICTED: uncharacterized protein LOC106124287 [Papilio xuthus]|uniref:Uncharacterized protein LOC106124287 n=1 Tax=Papilio xuthus TaxID=66420 RepID=A0AAJ7EG77_PAPXU|nr:PREDICTED: uncharacterized protein LOC106124287 [Papilio xuthus]
MFLFKILCVFSSIKIIENVSKHFQTATEKYQTYEIEDNVINDDQVNEISRDNGDDRKLKMYAELQSALQNMNADQKFLFEDALNKYIAGNITEDEIIDLLPNILLIDEESREFYKQHERDKYKSKSCSRRNDTNIIETDDPECSKDVALYLKANMNKHSSMYTKYYYKPNSTPKSRLGEYRLGEIDDEIHTTYSNEIDTTFITREATIPLIIDLIKSFKNQKMLKTTKTYIYEYPSDTPTDEITEDSSTEEIKQDNEEKRHMIDVLTLLNLLDNLTNEYTAQTMRRSWNNRPTPTAPLCPYTISFGTSPRYKYQYPYFERNRTGTLVNMCYVCGLEEAQIPMSSLCETAFDRDDWTYKKYSYKFIKYCRYDQYTNNYCVHTRDKRSIWGRWTGGCSMRRIDISGVYTQRSCRNREWPTRGHHFASHRMARLEFVLNDVKDGCTVSPGASLVPLSRGISLYARFIACVCRESLCNAGISYMLFSYVRLFAHSFTPMILLAAT